MRSHRKPPRTVWLIPAAITVCLASTGLTTTSGLSSYGAGTTVGSTIANDYMAYAFSASLLTGVVEWAETMESARDSAKAGCHKQLKVDDCIDDPWAKAPNFVAVAFSTPDGPWGWQSNKTREAAEEGAIKWCKHYGGDDDCKIGFVKQAGGF